MTIHEAGSRPNHPSVAIALNNLAEVLMRHEQWRDARATYERARAIFVAVLGPEATATEAWLAARTGTR